ncbi:hypothetical protein LY76DRAFT_609874 [Colletotrichum caudatum]|nr:hypothetical protein LY76DRAFT_609874 [Colletotrichum caudatum]
MEQPLTLPNPADFLSREDYFVAITERQLRDLLPPRIKQCYDEWLEVYGISEPSIAGTSSPRSTVDPNRYRRGHRGPPTINDLSDVTYLASDVEQVPLHLLSNKYTELGGVYEEWRRKAHRPTASGRSLAARFCDSQQGGSAAAASYNNPAAMVQPDDGGGVGDEAVVVPRTRAAAGGAREPANGRESGGLARRCRDDTAGCRPQLSPSPIPSTDHYRQTERGGDDKSHLEALVEEDVRNLEEINERYHVAAQEAMGHLDTFRQLSLMMQRRLLRLQRLEAATKEPRGAPNGDAGTRAAPVPTPAAAAATRSTAHSPSAARGQRRASLSSCPSILEVSHKIPGDRTIS